MNAILKGFILILFVCVSISYVASAAGLFSVTKDQAGPATYSFTEDPDFYQSDRIVTQFHYDFGDGNGSDEHNPVYTYKTSGTFYPTLKTIWKKADGREYTTETKTSIQVFPNEVSSELPTPANTSNTYLNPNTGAGFIPVSTPVPENTVGQFMPTGIFTGFTPLPTPTGLISDIFFNSQPGIYPTGLPEHQIGETYWGEIPGYPGVFGWITVTEGSGILV